MINKIFNALKDNNISTYLININCEHTAELFFIKNNLDMRRMKDVTKYEVTCYHDFTKNDVKMRGFAVCQLSPDMSSDEISVKLKDAYFAASFACNPYFPLPSPAENTKYSPKEPFSTEYAINQMTEALFDNDTSDECFINSAELFIKSSSHKIISSEGIDVSYNTQCIEGEFVAQCTSPQDVETYQDFYYTFPDTEALREKVNRTLQLTRDRAIAKPCTLNEKVKVILSGQYVSDLLNFYVSRSSASLIYPKYSDFTLNSQVQADNIKMDALNIILKANEPYSSEGIAMYDLPLLNNGVLQTIHGTSRFCYYLDVKPTGNYTDISVPAGSHSLSEMESGKYLHIVNFSDFQMDSLSGRFGGEFRLAFYCDGENIIPITGGSISGSILELADNLTLSKETQKLKGYEGPLAISIDNVQI